MIDQDYPLESLRRGRWFKLICGASFQHLPAIRTLVLAYSLAGADCIDVAADPAVILAAKEAIDLAISWVEGATGVSLDSNKPLLMVSLNDGEDPHFRKAEFSAGNCPPECHRPCESICPASAIAASGVITDRCYGCGRCLPICPIQHISARSYVSTPSHIATLVSQTKIDAIEIHTQVGHLENFGKLWNAIKPWVKNLKLVAISCPDGNNLINYLQTLYQIIGPLHCPLIWQTDGRPMSGDLGIGATRATIKLGQKVLDSGLPGYVQLAGGTNHYTVPKLRSLNLLNPDSSPHNATSCSNSLKPRQRLTQPTVSLPYLAGVAYGSYARSLLTPILNQLETIEMTTAKPVRIETLPDLLNQAIDLAHSLVTQLKPFQVMSD